jgi:hypothetical protein
MVAAMGVAVGCGAEEAAPDSAGIEMPTTQEPQPEDDDGEDASTSTPVPPPPDTSSGPQFDVKYDLGVIPDMPGYDDSGCQAIDFLFVIDNSGSMSSQQTQLLASFDGFITAIQDSLEDVDSYHVGVITSDNYTGNAPGCTTIGDLVTQTSGWGALGQDCLPFEEGHRFATEQDDLVEKFPCIAQIGTAGSPIEQPVTATIAALDPAKAENGACNENFVRDNAILVIVIVTDDPPYDFDMDDAHPNTDTSTWHDDVVAAKAGNPDALVVIGFVPWMDTSCTGGSSPNLIEFVESFEEQGVIASICLPDYGPVFAEAISTIESTCENFIPPY